MTYYDIKICLYEAKSCSPTVIGFRAHQQVQMTVHAIGIGVAEDGRKQAVADCNQGSDKVLDIRKGKARR